MCGGELRESLDQRDADVAAKDDRSRPRPEHGGDERRRRRLTFGPGDANRRRRTQSQEQIDLADDGNHAFLLKIRDGGAQSWLCGRVATVDRWRSRDQRLAL